MLTGVNFVPFQVLHSSISLTPSQVAEAVHMARGRLAHSLWELGVGVAGRAPFSLHHGFVLWWLVVASDHRGADEEEAAIVTPPRW